MGFSPAQGAAAGTVAGAGSGAPTKIQAVSQAGPASYSAGGFTVTFDSLSTLAQAVVAQQTSAQFKFVVSAVSTNVATVKCFKRLPTHVHNFLVVGGTTGTNALVTDATPQLGKVAAGNQTVTGNASGGVQDQASSAAEEEVANGTVLSGTTLSLVGFGT